MAGSARAKDSVASTTVPASSSFDGGSTPGGGGSGVSRALPPSYNASSGSLPSFDGDMDIEPATDNPHVMARVGPALLAAQVVAAGEALECGHPVDYVLRLDDSSFKDIAQPGQLSSPSDPTKPVRFPRLRVEELARARPSPRAFFCPSFWAWTVVLPLPSAPSSTRSSYLDIDQRCEGPDAVGSELGFTREGAVCGSHAFVRNADKVDPTTLDGIDWEPVPLWTETGAWDPIGAWRALATERTARGSRGRWDLWVCVCCGAAVVVAPQRNLIPGVLRPEEAAALTKVRSENPDINQSREVSVYKAWETLYMVLVNALVMDKRDALPLNGVSIRRRLPWEENSARIWAALGCQIRRSSPAEDLLVPPSLDVRTAEGRQRRAQWIRATVEVGLFLRWLLIKHPHMGEKVLSRKYASPFHLVPDPLEGPILASFGGDNASRSFVLDKRNDPILRHALATLGCPLDVVDDVVYAAYQCQCRSSPRSVMESFAALSEVADSRKGKLVGIVRQERQNGAFGRQEYEAALEVICGTRNAAIDDDVVMDKFTTHLDAHPEESQNLIHALGIVQRARASDLLQAALASTAGKIRAQLSPEQAYERLGVSQTIEDDVILTAYEFAIVDQPGRKDMLADALAVIGETRKSQLIGYFIEHGTRADPSEMQLVLANTASRNLPAGLNNIGNTCYLNSLLQFLFSVKELREVILDFPTYQQDEAIEDKRVGGRLVSPAEIRRSKQFVGLLKDLFHAMIHSSLSAVTPQHDLAYLALVSSKDDEQEGTAHPSSRSTDATLVDEPGFIGPTLPPQPDPRPPSTTPPEDAASPSSVLGKRKSESRDLGPGPDEPTSESPMDVDSPPKSRGGGLIRQDTDGVMARELASKLEPPSNAHEHERSKTLSAPATSQDPIDVPRRAHTAPVADTPAGPPVTSEATPDEPISAGPPLPPRPPKRSLTAADRGSAMLFGRQNDVSECLDNCFFQIQAALDEKKLAAVGSNIVKELFYGTTRQSLVFDKPEAKTSVKEEQFAYLLVDVAEEGRDLYDALDNVFDEVEVEVNGGSARRRVSLVELPPILQIQLQRVQFDRTTSSVFKSNAYLRFDDRLHMDRYVEPDGADGDATQRWKATLEKRQEMEQLRARASALGGSLPGDKRSPNVVLRDLATVLTSPHSPFPHLFDGILADEDILGLQEEADALQTEAVATDEKLSGLRKDVEELWKDSQVPAAEYRLVSLFIHRGTAAGGHYWALQRNLPAGPEWINYNDSTVTVGQLADDQVFADTKDETTNPYWLTYVRVGDEDRFEMVKREFE